MYSYSLQITKFKNSAEPKQDNVPAMYCLSKMHKTPFQANFIANSSSCKAKLLPVLLTSRLSDTIERIVRYANRQNITGKRSFWSIKIE